MRAITSRVAGLFLSALLGSLASAQSTGTFEVHFDESAFESDFTGEVFVAFGEVDGTEPRRAMHGWFDAPPVLRFELNDISPGEVVVLDPARAASSHPVDWATVEAAEWSIQVVARLSQTGRRAGFGTGDAYSDAEGIVYDSESTESLSLCLENVVEPDRFEETERFKLFELKSEALSKFHGFDYTLRAGVMLPKNYAKQVSYPVVYSVTGFGGSHRNINRWKRRVPEGDPLENAIIVVPDASNRYGHSVFCDSDSIGPWGEALVHELIPALEAKFGGAGAEQRYVTGVSSGGWSSLWLQVAYPDEFAGCWSHCPDPIDFHDFQQIDLYTPLPDGKPRNMYVDEQGNSRPLARRDGLVRMTYEDFVRREHVLNPGGQIRSFEATFGSLGPDGTPDRVFDVETGEIDHVTAQSWRKYDISHQLLTRWDDLRGALKGKINIFAGEVDSFYLEGAVERFQTLAQEAGMLDDMLIQVIPGMGHSLHRAGHQAMVETIDARWREANNP